MKKNIKYHTVRTVQKSDCKSVEKGKLGTPNTPRHDGSLLWLGPGTSIKSAGVQLI
jgi:hypothetical protein